MTQAPTSAADALRAGLADIESSSTVGSTLHWFDFLSRGLDLNGATVLDLGCGEGALSLYLALRRGARVLALDQFEQQGSDAQYDRVSSRLAWLNVRSVFLERGDFWTWQPDSGQVQVAFATYALHHFYETDRRIMKDAEARERYREVLERIAGWVAPGGQIVIGEVLHSNIAKFVNYYGSTIDWGHHQNPEDWNVVLREAGFDNLRCEFYVPHKVRALSSVLDNRYAAWLGKSIYRIVADRA